MAINTRYGPFWWSTSLFFSLSHVAAAIGVYFFPIWTVPKETFWLMLACWECAMLGVGVGYHRLVSHNSFKSGVFVKWMLMIFGASAFQGSAKFWATRHRLHHRWTDDPVHDPHAASRGMWWAHIGWTFFHPTYERMKYVDKSDIDNDKIFMFQHNYFTPMAFITGWLLPAWIASHWQSPMSAFVWAGLVKCVIVWHCTFSINSLAHWHGVQPYSDDNTSKTSLLVSILTGGEGNHNFHSFPHDYRTTPDFYNWDPCGWTIFGLYKLGLITRLRTVSQQEIDEAKQYMAAKYSSSTGSLSDDDYDDEKINNEKEKTQKHPLWTMEETKTYASAAAGRCVLVIDGYVVDATKYMGEHPGGAKLLRQYSIRTGKPSNDSDSDTADSDMKEDWNRATWAFEGGLNRHTPAAKRVMVKMAIAKLWL